MKKSMTKQDVLNLMRTRQGKRTQREFAEELGISQQYLCDIYKGAKDPGESVLRALGLRRQMTYHAAI